MGETRQQGLLLGHGHVFALASAVRPGLECLDAPVIVSHMRAVYCAQRNAHGRRNRRLRHPALAQQHHLDALSLLRRKLPSQRRLEPPDLGLTAFYQLLLPNQMVTANHISNPENNSPIDRILRQKIRRFMLFWSRYQSMMHSKKWSWLKAWAMQIARRRGMKKAIVALARRLAVIMHRIWIDGTEFRWTREQAAAAA